MKESRSVVNVSPMSVEVIERPSGIMAVSFVRTPPAPSRPVKLHAALRPWRVQKTLRKATPCLVVPTECVLNLVNDFLRSGKRYCSTFDPKGLQAAFMSLPERWTPRYVDFHEAGRVLDHFECDKLTASCNTWTPWMRQRLRLQRRRLETVVVAE